MRTLALALIALTACESCYHLPAWKGQVKVTPFEREAFKLCGGKGGLTEAGRERISREPYMQSTTPTSTIVAWGSLDLAGEVIIKEPGGDIVSRSSAGYVGDPAREDRRRAAAKAKRKTDRDLPADDIYVVAAKLGDLKPGHLYCYQVLVNGVAMTEPAPMNTAAVPGGKQSTKFVAVGDVGTGGPAQEAIEQRMTESPFDFVLFLGDIAYERGTPAQIQGRFFAMYKEILRYVPIFPAIGNHERVTRKGGPYFEAFVLPEPERYYSFNWGDVHFVCIDTTQRDSQQLLWLDEDLTRNKLPWVIVFGHHPMYTNSLRGAQMWIRKAFAKIVTDHKVDIVLTGHEHQYERFKIAGVNYVVSGGGGGQLTRFFGSERSLKQATTHHYLAFEATADKLTMKAIDINGKEIETLALEKTSGGQKKTNDPRQNPVLPEKEIKPDDKIHDEPDDDIDRRKVAPPITEPTPVPAQTTDATPPKKPGASPNTTSPRP